MIKYLKNNLLIGYKTSPLRELKLSLGLLLLFALTAFFIGYKGNLYEIKNVEIEADLYIAYLSIYISIIFGGIILPRNYNPKQYKRERSLKKIIIATLLSSLMFTLWHPLNAVTVNLTAKNLFLNPYFLMVVFCLGLICSLTYIYSKSLWIPIIFHWFTVLVWVIFLGGRNLILE